MREQHPFPKPNHAIRSDFTMFDKNNTPIHIEVWGYEKSDNYTSRSAKYGKNRIKKEQLYKKYKIRLISINYNLFQHSLLNIQKALKELFKREINVELKNINNELLIAPNKLKDEELLEIIMKYSNNNYMLPKQETLIKEVPEIFNQIIKRHGNQNNFARKFNKLSYSKKGLWDEELVYKIFNSCIKQYGYIPSITEMKNKKLHKTNCLLIGFPDGIKKVYGSATTGYLKYFNTMVAKNKPISNHDIKYIERISHNTGNINKQNQNIALDLLEKIKKV